MIAVLGGGFGLYGHLAALAGFDFPLATLARYRQDLESRPELSGLIGHIDFIAEQQAMEASLLVLARRPQDNCHLAELRLGAGHPLTVIEKPISSTPEGALAIHQSFLEHKLSYRTPFLFLHTGWGESLLSHSWSHVKIIWRFPDRNPVLTWKREASEGGGALAYYFIHFLPLLARMADAEPEISLIGRSANFDGMAVSARWPRKEMELYFDIGDLDPLFLVEIDGVPIASDVGPFGEAGRRGAIDPRVAVLKRFYRDEVFDPTVDPMPVYGRVYRLWSELDNMQRHASEVCLP